MGSHIYSELPNEFGYFGKFGGRFVPETLIYALDELTETYTKHKNDIEFKKELNYYYKNYIGRATPLYFAKNLSRKIGGKIYLKREDLCHTGSHKLNNVLGQLLLAKKMGKKRIIAETGAGQHGVATATGAALLDMECIVYMGEEDTRRQALNVFRMELLGAKVISVKVGTRTLKDAINEAFRDWMAHATNTFYCIGSCVGPHPYPMMVRDFQSIIGLETKEQHLAIEGKNPEYLVACTGGGSNSIGLFYPFLNDPEVTIIGCEASGAASLTQGNIGVFQGARTYVLQTKSGQIKGTHSISAGLDYSAVGPEHSYLKDIGRVQYVGVNDKEALEGFKLLSQAEGIIPALESSHAIGYLKKLRLKENKTAIVCLSGRGDKDVENLRII